MGVKTHKRVLLRKEFSIIGFEESGEYIIDETLDSFVYESSNTYFCRTLGFKQYEMVNHLGNVLATVLDRKTGVFDSGADTLLYYTADVVNATLYYPFGQAMLSYSNVEFYYSYGMGGHEKIDEVQGSGNVVDMGDRWLDTRLGRTAKIDAHASNYPSLSPYSYAANNPIYFIDPDGRDNIIYLVYLPSSDNKIKVSDAKKIAEQTTKNFQSLGLKTKVVLVDMSKKGNEDFNPSDIDRTDGIAVLGTHSNAIDYVAKHNQAFGKKLKEEWGGGAYEPELSENNGADPKKGGGGKYIALDANALTGAGNLFGGIDKIKTGALLINHGAGHTAGQNHAHDGSQRGNSVIMSDGNRLSKALLNNPNSPYYKDYDKLVSNDENQNQDYVNAMKERYGDNPACNSYEPK